MTEEDLKAKNSTYIGGFMNFVKKGTEKLSIGASSMGSNNSDSGSNNNKSGSDELAENKQSDLLAPPTPNSTDLYKVFPGDDPKGEVQVYSQPTMSDVADDKLGEERLSEDIQKRGDRKLSIENVKV